MKEIKNISLIRKLPQKPKSKLEILSNLENFLADSKRYLEETSKTEVNLNIVEYDIEKDPIFSGIPNPFAYNPFKK